MIFGSFLFLDTSSFFKLSLKTNNKALALALGAQKQKTRQLETETMSLQKDVQALRFELAIQRYKNKQMVSVQKAGKIMLWFCGFFLVKALNRFTIQISSLVQIGPVAVLK